MGLFPVLHTLIGVAFVFKTTTGRQADVIKTCVEEVYISVCGEAGSP